MENKLAVLQVVSLALYISVYLAVLARIGTKRILIRLQILRTWRKSNPPTATLGCARAPASCCSGARACASARAGAWPVPCLAGGTPRSGCIRKHLGVS